MNSLSLSVLFAFLAMLSWGVGDFLIQRLVRRLGSLEAMFWINLIAAVALLPFALRDLPAIFLPGNLFPVMGIMAMEFLFTLSIFKAYGAGRLTVVEMILLAEVPLTVVLGMVLLGETLNVTQYSLVALIMVGVFLVSRNTLSIRGLRIQGRWEKGLLLALSAVVFSSLYNYYTTVNARNISPFSAVWIPWVASLLVITIYLWRKRGLGSVFVRASAHPLLIVFTGIIDTTAWVLYGFALLEKEVSIVTAIVAGYAVIATVLDIRFNKQVMKSWQYVGAGMVLTGAIILSIY